jgi:hypothetical protein
MRTGAKTDDTEKWFETKCYRLNDRLIFTGWVRINYKLYVSVLIVRQNNCDVNRKCTRTIL